MDVGELLVVDYTYLVFICTNFLRENILFYRDSITKIYNVQ